MKLNSVLVKRQIENPSPGGGGGGVLSLAVARGPVPDL